MFYFIFVSSSLSTKGSSLRMASLFARECPDVLFPPLFQVWQQENKTLPITCRVTFFSRFIEIVSRIEKWKHAGIVRCGWWRESVINSVVKDVTLVVAVLKCRKWTHSELAAITLFPICSGFPLNRNVCFAMLCQSEGQTKNSVSFLASFGLKKWKNKSSLWPLHENPSTLSRIVQ